MKVFIWFMCFFINSVITTILKFSGYTLGAIPTVLLFLATIFVAKNLCKMWEHRKNNKTNNSVDNNILDTNNVSNAIFHEQTAHICLSDPNEQPEKQGNFNVCGSDILLEKTEKEMVFQPIQQETKTFFTVHSFANSLAKMASQELLNIMNLCSDKQIEIDERKLLISSFAYFYGIWTFNYKNITTEQEKLIQEIYKKQFSEFNRTAFENDTFKQVVDNEYEFDKLLYYILKRINEYQEKFENNHSVEYEKIADEFISEFISNEKEKEQIKFDIKTKITRDWALVANKTGQVSEIKNNK